VLTEIDMVTRRLPVNSVRRWHQLTSVRSAVHVIPSRRSLAPKLPCSRRGQIFGEVTIASAMIGSIVHHIASWSSRAWQLHQKDHIRVDHSPPARTSPIRGTSHRLVTVVSQIGVALQELRGQLQQDG
jgi:hypothetical protein